MKGTISKINPIKYSRNGNSYIRVEFKLEDGAWACSDIFPGYRNYSRWKPLMIVGTDLDKLELIKAGKVNADSYPVAVKIKATKVWKQMPDGSMALIEIPKEQVIETLEKQLIQEKLL